ncbi:MAG: PolC-type DNA polymerase III [Oscillospiraceae bacterium]|nr:PolC-type DNA polymerase III [Oscillospiraceae bacterium]
MIEEFTIDSLFGESVDLALFPPELRNAPARILDLDQRSRRMKLEIRPGVWVAPEIIEQFCAAAERALGDCMIRCAVSFPPEAFGPAAYPWLLRELRGAIVVANGFLDNALVTREGETLLIELPPIGKVVLDDADAPAWLRRFLRERFGLGLEVVFVASEAIASAAKPKRKPAAKPVPVRSAPAAGERPPWAAAPPPEQNDIPAAGAAPAKAPARPPREARPKRSDALWDGLPFSMETTKTLYGNAIRSRPTPISEIDVSDGSAVVWGEVFRYREITTKDGRSKILSFNITDYTDSYPCKLFDTVENCQDLCKHLKDGTFLLMRGVFQLDKYSDGYSLQPRAMMKVTPILPQDAAPEKRVELHLHTNMSEMDGMTPAAKLVERAAFWGHKAVAITDHGVVQAFPEAMQAAEKAAKKGKDIKIIYGMEAYYVNDLRPVVLDPPKDGALPFGGEYIVFDVETTGLSPDQDRLIEIGAVRVRNGQSCESFQTFVDPQRPLPPKIVELTGIGPEMLAGAPGEWEAAQAFSDFCGGAPLVAHNARFDLHFLKALYRRQGQTFRTPCADTLVLAQLLLQDVRNYRLDTLAGYFGAGAFGHHRADEDARTTAKIFLGLLETARQRQAEKPNYQALLAQAEAEESAKRPAADEPEEAEPDEKPKSHHRKKVDEKQIFLAEARRWAEIPDLEEDLLWFLRGYLRPEIPKLRSYHMILLAQNLTGLKNLYRLITSSNVRTFHRHPCIPRSELEKHREGLILGSACEAGELFSALLDHYAEEELLQIADFYDYLEIQPNGNNAFLLRGKENHAPRVASEEALHQLNRRIVHLADDLGKPVCATGDVHFLDEKDKLFREVIMSGQGFEDAGYQAPLHFRTTQDMLAEFAYLGEETAFEVVVKNPGVIADRVEVIRPFPEGTFPPSIPGAEEELTELCYSRMRKRYGDPLPDVVAARLEKELRSIIDNNFAVLYIIAQKLVKDSEDHGYYVGSRGSVGSSFVANAAGISEVNPLEPHYLCPACHYAEFFRDGSVGSGFDLPPKNCPQCGAPLQRDGHDIPFETFLGFKGNKQPDIDLNFSGEYQFFAHRYTEQLFGKTHVFKAGTIGTLADKTAYGFVKKYADLAGRELRRAEMERLTQGCIGVKRTTSQHPGGMVVIPSDMEAEDFTPIQFPANDPNKGMTTHFDFHALHDTILKLDNLGHDVPTLYKYLEDMTGIRIEQADVCDPKIYQLLRSPEPLGVTAEDIDCPTGTLSLPELGTNFVLQMLVDAKPKNFSDMLQISGLSHGTDVWLGNAQDLILSGKCDISEVISTRDSIMTYLMHKGVPAATAFDIMEIVRKGKAKEALTDEHKRIMKENGVENWYIDSCLKIQYMFPKAHAAAYVLAAMRLAWYKIYCPLEYYAAYLTVRGSDLDTRAILQGRPAVLARLRELQKKVHASKNIKSEQDKATPKEEAMIPALQVVNEMMARGVNFLPTDLYRSDAFVYLMEDGKIRLPFSALEGVGNVAAQAMAKAREDGEGEYLAQEDLQRRANLNSQVMQTLATLGALAGLPKFRQTKLHGF